MKTQIAVRIDEKLVQFLDEQVKAGSARSRAELVESALEREIRRRLYERDVEILNADPHDPDLEALTEWMVGRYPSVD